MDTDDVAEYVERSQSLIDSSPQMDEQNTRRKLIEPLLEVLGWEMLSAEVELEYSVQMGVGTKKVDYALMLEDVPVVLVEAKGVDSSISDSHRSQLKSYMRQTGVDWGLLTNGKQFEILKRKTDGARPNEVSLGRFSIAKLPENVTLLRALSKDVIEAGEAERIAQNIEATQRAARTLRRNKDEIATRISQVVTDEVGEAVSQTIENGSKQFVDILATSLAQQGQEDATVDWDDELTLEEDPLTEWTPAEGKNAIAGTIARDDLSGPADATVAIFPTRESGIKFLRENNAWGFVRVKQDPDYAAFYVAGGPSEIRYVATVTEIVPAEEATLARDAETYTGGEAGFDPDDQVVMFEPGSLYELSDPIPYEGKAPQSRVYTDLASFKRGGTTKEVY
jgi:predicted type IV restriction endonuclease